MPLRSLKLLFVVIQREQVMILTQRTLSEFTTLPVTLRVMKGANYYLNTTANNTNITHHPFFMLLHTWQSCKLRCSILTLLEVTATLFKQYFYTNYRI